MWLVSYTVSQLSKMFNPLFLLVTIRNIQQVHVFVSRIAFLFNNLALLMLKRLSL